MLLDLDTIASTYPMITIRAHPPFADPSSICSLLCEGCFERQNAGTAGVKSTGRCYAEHRIMSGRSPTILMSSTGTTATPQGSFSVSRSLTAPRHMSMPMSPVRYAEDRSCSISASTTSSPLGKPTSEPVLSAQLRLQYSVGGLAPGRLAAGGCFPPPIRNEVGYSAATRIKGVETDARRRRHAEARR